MRQLIQFLQRTMVPRYMIEPGAMREDDMRRLCESMPGDLVRVPNGDQITMLPMPPINLHLGARRRMPTAAMGPTMRGRPRSRRPPDQDGFLSWSGVKGC